jgi:predicted ribosome quality control (RQC) complex YloA/Tae2 family protein
MLRIRLIWLFAVVLISAPLAQAKGTDDHPSSVEAASRWQEELEKRFGELEHRLEKYGRDLEKLPERKEYRQMKSRLGQWLSEMERTGEEVRDKVESQLLPKIRKELDAIEQWLRQRTQKSRGIYEV